MSEVVRHWITNSHRLKLQGTKCMECDTFYIRPTGVCYICEEKGDIYNSQTLPNPVNQNTSPLQEKLV